MIVRVCQLVLQVADPARASVVLTAILFDQLIEFGSLGILVVATRRGHLHGWLVGGPLRLGLVVHGYTLGVIRSSLGGLEDNWVELLHGWLGLA